MINVLEGKGFYVEPVERYKKMKNKLLIVEQKVGSKIIEAKETTTLIGFYIIHKTRDLIISLTKGSQM